MIIGSKRKILSENYATTPNKELSLMLGLSVGMVKRYAGQMGLRKDSEYLSSVHRECGLKSPMSKYWKCFRGK